MAVRKMAIMLGDSNASGLAKLSEVTNADFDRWTGKASWPTGSWPIGTPFPNFPKDVSVSDVLMLTANMPHTLADERNITAVGSPNAITCDGANFVAADEDSWCYIAGVNTTGYGQVLRIDANPTGGKILTVLDPLSGGNPTNVVAATGECHILTGSHTVASAAHVVGEDQTTITKTSTTPDFGAAADDYIGVIATATASLAALGLTRRIIGTPTANTITVTPALTVLPIAGDGIRELKAANTVRKLSDLGVAANCAFRPLRFYHDGSTSYSNPDDKNSYQSFPFRNPKQFLTNDGVNGLPELAWALKSHIEGPLYMVHEAAGGASAHPNPAQTDFSGVDTSFSYGLDLDYYDFRPGSTNGLMDALTKRLTAAKAIAVAASDTIDVILIASNLGTNDGTTQVIADQYLESMGEIIDYLRDYLVTNSMSTLVATRIPFALTSVNATVATRPFKATVNAAQLTLAAAKQSVYVIDASGFTLESDDIHLNAAGQVSWGQSAYAGYLIEREDHTLLVVETGAGSTTANSYASLQAADTYHQELAANPTAWSGATQAVRQAALREATRIIDDQKGHRWRGQIRTYTQALLWPRSLVRDERGYAVLHTEIPVGLVRATAALALRIVNGDDPRPDVAAGEGNVGNSSISVGPISIAEDFIGTATCAPTYPEVEQLLRGLLRADTSGVLRRLTR